MSSSILVRAKRIALPDGIRPASVRFNAESILAVEPYDADPFDSLVTDVGNSVVFPGLVDTHVHINEPGRTDWEGFRSATRAAAAGGVTTLLDMPLNTIPATTSVSALRDKREAMRGQLRVDVGCIGGVVPGNAAELLPLWRNGVIAFKCFLVPSGVPEFEHVGERDLRLALPILASLGAVLMVHAEASGPINRATRSLATTSADPCEYGSWLDSRPEASELEAIEMLAALSAEFGARVHIVHLSAASALATLERARRGTRPGLLTAETCPHYLTFAAEDISHGATSFKCAPPLRGHDNRELLWIGLRTGAITTISTDHSPCPPAMKATNGDFFAAWGGIASLQLMLPAVWTEARARGFDLAQLSRWLSSEPARLAGLDRRKGTIRAGADADLVIWDPDATFVVAPAHLEHRHPITPYAGRSLIGVVERTYLRGQVVFDRGDFSGDPLGRPLGAESR